MFNCLTYTLATVAMANKHIYNFITSIFFFFLYYCATAMFYCLTDHVEFFTQLLSIFFFFFVATKFVFFFSAPQRTRCIERACDFRVDAVGREEEENVFQVGNGGWLTVVFLFYFIQDDIDIWPTLLSNTMIIFFIFTVLFMGIFSLSIAYVLSSREQ